MGLTATPELLDPLRRRADRARRRALRLGVLAMGALLAGGCAGEAPPRDSAQPRAATPAASPEATTDPARGAKTPEVVRIPDRNGPVTGAIFGDGGAGVVLSPQLGQDRRYWFPLARVLAREGYTAISIDSRYLDIDGEVLLAERYLRRHGARWVAAIGASKGGTAVLGAATRAPMPVVGVSPVVEYGDVTLTRRSIERLEAPALVIVDVLDGADNDATQLGKWGGETLEVVRINAGGAHGTAYLDSGKRQVFYRTIVDFLRRSRDGRK